MPGGALSWAGRMLLPDKPLFPVWVLLVFAIAMATAAAGALPLLTLKAAFSVWRLVAVCSLLVWLLSIPMKDVSIVDIWWGLSFPAQAWWALLFAQHPRDDLDADGQQPAAPTPRQVLLLVLVTVWGVRLGGYLLLRKMRGGWIEDHRYMLLAVPFCRRGVGPTWAVCVGSLFQVSSRVRVGGTNRRSESEDCAVSREGWVGLPPSCACTAIAVEQEAEDYS